MKIEEVRNNFIASVYKYLHLFPPHGLFIVVEAGEERKETMNGRSSATASLEQVQKVVEESITSNYSQDTVCHISDLKLSDVIDLMLNEILR